MAQTAKLLVIGQHPETRNSPYIRHVFDCRHCYNPITALATMSGENLCYTCIKGNKQLHAEYINIKDVIQQFVDREFTRAYIMAITARDFCAGCGMIFGDGQYTHKVTGGRLCCECYGPRAGCTVDCDDCGGPIGAIWSDHSECYACWLKYVKAAIRKNGEFSIP